MTRHSRRRFLRTAACLAAGLAAGCRTRPDPDVPGAFAGRSLRVSVPATYEKAMREAFVPAFEKRTGATVSLSLGGADAVQTLKAAPPKEPPFDLLAADAAQGHPAAREGLFAKLDLKNVPSHETIAPAALDSWVF